MLLSLLAPNAGSLTVLAQDVSQPIAESTSSVSKEQEATGSETKAETNQMGTGDQSADDTPTQSNQGKPLEPVQPDSKDKESQSESSIVHSGSQSQSPTDQIQPKVPQVGISSTQPASKESEVTPALSPLLPLASSLTLDMPVVSSVNTYAAYVEHWSGKDAYTHHLLSRRYGIKAEQIDGFLKSKGIAYDSNRINGATLLQWEKESGLDVRAIIAIAMSESSLGTKGVATLLGSNMFGYAVFDLDPAKVRKFNDELAIIKMTQETIIKNNNTNFALQDLKATKFSLGRLNFAVDGGVYFTDTTGSGKRRAQIMEDVDKWIDAHGGTPPIPEALKMQSSSSFALVPVGYKVSKSYDVLSYQATSYAWGQCTWYVYNRAKELGYQFDPFMGNGADWKHKAGYKLSTTPKVGYAISFAPGQAGADGVYGHVSIVEDVRKDGSILISESNGIGLGKVSYRTFTAQQAEQLTYVIGKNNR